MNHYLKNGSVGDSETPNNMVSILAVAYIVTGLD